MRIARLMFDLLIHSYILLLLRATLAEEIQSSIAFKIGKVYIPTLYGFIHNIYRGTVDSESEKYKYRESHKRKQ